MNDKIDIKSLNFNELKAFVEEIGEKAFRAKQIYEWIHVKNVDSFDEIQNNSIIIAHKDDYDVQDLLIRSSVLVTDYSSVFFDFAYMGKPVIYYQFDEDEFRKNHYQEGYFSYREHGFGRVLKYENERLKEKSKND